MSGITRIGTLGTVSRETPSSGHDVVERRERAERPPTRNSAVDQVAKLYEKQFLSEMLKAMRSTVSFSDMTKPTMAENIYRDQLDDQYIEAWGDQGGIGLSDLIYEQIMERYFGQSVGRDLKAQGPIELSDRDVLRVMRVRPSNPEAARNGEVPLRVEIKPSGASASSRLRAPWDGEVALSAKLDGKSAVTLAHSSGLRSTLIFDGVPSAQVQPGRKIEKGEAVGILSPEIHSFLWNLKSSPSTAGSERGGSEAVGSGSGSASVGSN